jgi:sucrose phosphorylase
VGRDINRHYYTRGEVDEAVRNPLVADLFDLIRLRNTHPAFAGAFELGTSPEEALDLRWRNGSDFAHLYLDLRSCDYRLELTRNGAVERHAFRSVR